MALLACPTAHSLPGQPSEDGSGALGAPSPGRAWEGTSPLTYRLQGGGTKARYLCLNVGKKNLRSVVYIPELSMGSG